MKKQNPIVPIIACLIVQLCVGILYLWSALRSDVVKSFNWTDAAAGMVSSYMIFAFVFGNLIGGIINDRKGAKLTCFLGMILFAAGIGLTGLLNENTVGLLNITYAVMGGLGSGFAYGACISCIQKWLPHKRGLASGLACGAFGLSTVVFTPVSTALMDAFRNEEGIVNFIPVFFILCGVFAVLGLIACIFVSLPDEDYVKSLNLPEKAVSTARNYTLGEAVKTPAFWALFFSIFFINGTWNLCVPLIKNLGIVRGLTPAMAVACVSFTGITNAAGRLIMASASDKIGRFNAMHILCVITLVGAVLTTFITCYGYFFAIAIIAFAYGGPSALNAALCTDLFGSKYSGSNYGVAMTALGFSSIFFNFIANNIIKASINVDELSAVGIMPTFIMGAVTAVVPIFLMIYINSFLKKRNA